MRELERRFPPEFRNRIDEVVLFAPLTKPEVRQMRSSISRRSPRPCGDAASRCWSTTSARHDRRTGPQPRLWCAALKRVIDECVKLPISEHWSIGQQFRVRVDGERVVVDGGGPRLVASTPEPPALAYGT